MTLSDWFSKQRVMLLDVKVILASEGKPDATELECREWAREFIRRYIPRWQPGDQMHPEHARLIGGAFERQVARARRQFRRFR